MKRDRKPLTILRTAAGSAPIPAQCKYLQKLGIRVVTVDIDPLSVGFYFSDRAYTVPRVDEPHYVEQLLEICRNEQVDALLPALDEELILISEARQYFNQVGTTLLLSSTDTLKVCTDKLVTFEFFEKHSIPTISTLDGDNIQIEDIQTYPQIIKPRSGRGSTNVFLARNWQEVGFFAKYVGNAVVQPFIAGVEYTIDVVADWSSELLIVSPRKRIATDSGISYKGVTAWHEAVVPWISLIVKELSIVGPANIQCFLTADEQVYFTEVNARLAGSAILSVAAGIPLFEYIVAILQNKAVPPIIKPLVENSIMLRYWEELYITPQQASRFGWKDS